MLESEYAEHVNAYAVLVRVYEHVSEGNRVEALALYTRKRALDARVSRSSSKLVSM